MQRTAERRGKQEFHGEHAILQWTLGAMKLLICKSVMRKGENVLEKKLSLNKIQQGGKLRMPSCAPLAFYANFPVLSSYMDFCRKYCY